MKWLYLQCVGATFLAAALPAHGQPALPPAAEPSAAAITLARLLAPPAFLNFARVGEAEAAMSLEQQLLQSHYAPRGAPCDALNKECIAAARHVAAKYGPLQSRFAARIIDEAYARLFDATMSQADIAASTAFLRTGSGGKFRSALYALATPRQQDAVLLRSIYEKTLAGETRSPTQGMFDEFYDRTQSLPRGPARFAPPPPSPPR